MKIGLYDVDSHNYPKPFCTARGSNTIAKIIGRLNGYNTDLTDKALENEIDNSIGIKR